MPWRLFGMTPIELALFRDKSAHGVSAFDLSRDALALTLHPKEHRGVSVEARFRKPQLVSVDDSYAERRELPWDFIGFDSTQLPDDNWRFCLHTDCIEYVFDSP